VVAETVGVRMRRDLDLAREILLELEKHEGNPLASLEIEIPGRPQLEVDYHIMLLHEARLIKARDMSSMSTFKW
jgi:hypothetical protein